MSWAQWRKARLCRAATVIELVVCLSVAQLGGPLLSLANATAPSESTTASPQIESDLPPLPTVPKFELAPPERADVDELEARLQRLHSEDVEDRKESVREALEVRPRIVAAILLRLETLAARADRDRMKRAMAQIREKSNRASDASELGLRGSLESRPDLLLRLVEKARPKDDGGRDLTELAALSRMLTQIGNVHAARGLIEIYVRFGEFMRVDVQNRLFDLKDGAVAALIEARRHRAEKVARWADRQLDGLGKGVPSEAIRTDNFEVLADVLRAYGRIKDPDAARIIVSYASSERFHIREAARQAIVMLGEVGIWQLRDAYENVIGKRPRRDWSWDRTARELFFEYDRLHAKKAYELLEEGKKAAAEGRFEDMAKAYDALLARSPQFDKASSLTPGYFGLAEQFAQRQPALAQAALVRVERLATDPILRGRARSLRDTIRAEQQMLTGIVDAYVLHSAVERDPNNRRAKELLSFGDRATVEAQTLRTRWLTSGAIALIATVAILFVLLRRRARPPELASQADQSDAVKVGQAVAAPVVRAENVASCASARPQPSDATSTGIVPSEAPPRRRDPFEDF